MFDWLKKLFKRDNPPPKPPLEQFPPVPKWRPGIEQPIEAIVERVLHYTHGKRDLAVFQHGTCVVLPQNGLPESQVIQLAKGILDEIYKYHPDMNPVPADDGNVVIQYNHPAINVVLSSFAQTHWEEIERNHQDALATSEVLMTPLGPNKFDDFGKKALFGRCFMFMDAQNPEVVRVVRSAV
jgi:hypothetical protein